MKDFNKKYFIYIILIITIFIVFFLFFKKEKIVNNSNQNIVFSYPKEDLFFAWEKVESKNRFDTKERFDKEFLNTWYNLYQFFLYVKRLPIYIYYIEEELKKWNIPDDFKYLPIAESALRNDIVSSAWRAWIWQFMPDTARQYWLIVNDDIDERYNFEKSTISAIKYLNYLYWIFNNRSLVAASYNRWENAIKRILKEQNTKNYYDLYLNEETERYVFRILSIKYVLKDYETKKDYINNIIWWVFLENNIIKIKLWKTPDLKKWAEKNWYNYYMIKDQNKWILKDFLPDWDREINVIKKQ